MATVSRVVMVTTWWLVLLGNAPAFSFSSWVRRTTTRTTRTTRLRSSTLDRPTRTVSNETGLSSSSSSPSWKSSLANLYYEPSPPLHQPPLYLLYSEDDNDDKEKPWMDDHATAAASAAAHQQAETAWLLSSTTTTTTAEDHARVEHPIVAVSEPSVVADLLLQDHDHHKSKKEEEEPTMASVKETPSTTEEKLSILNDPEGDDCAPPTSSIAMEDQPVDKEDDDDFLCPDSIDALVQDVDDLIEQMDLLVENFHSTSLASPRRRRQSQDKEESSIDLVSPDKVSQETLVSTAATASVVAMVGLHAKPVVGMTVGAMTACLSLLDSPLGSWVRRTGTLAGIVALALGSAAASTPGRSTTTPTTLPTVPAANGSTERESTTTSGTAVERLVTEEPSSPDPVDLAGVAPPTNDNDDDESSDTMARRKEHDLEYPDEKLEHQGEPITLEQSAPQTTQPDDKNHKDATTTHRAMSTTPSMTPLMFFATPLVIHDDTANAVPGSSSTTTTVLPVAPSRTFLYEVTQANQRKLAMTRLSSSSTATQSDRSYWYDSSEARTRLQSRNNNNKNTVDPAVSSSETVWERQDELYSLYNSLAIGTLEPSMEQHGEQQQQVSQNRQMSNTPLPNTQAEHQQTWRRYGEHDILSEPFVVSSPPPRDDEDEKIRRQEPAPWTMPQVSDTIGTDEEAEEESPLRPLEFDPVAAKARLRGWDRSFRDDNGISPERTTRHHFNTGTTSRWQPSPELSSSWDLSAAQARMRGWELSQRKMEEPNSDAGSSMYMTQQDSELRTTNGETPTNVALPNDERTNGETPTNGEAPHGEEEPMGEPEVVSPMQEVAQVTTRYSQPLQGWQNSLNMAMPESTPTEAEQPPATWMETQQATTETAQEPAAPWMEPQQSTATIQESAAPWMQTQQSTTTNQEPIAPWMEPQQVATTTEEYTPSMASIGSLDKSSLVVAPPPEPMAPTRTVRSTSTTTGQQGPYQSFNPISVDQATRTEESYARGRNYAMGKWSPIVRPVTHAQQEKYSDQELSPIELIAKQRAENAKRQRAEAAAAAAAAEEEERQKAQEQQQQQESQEEQEIQGNEEVDASSLSEDWTFSPHRPQFPIGVGPYVVQ